MKLHKKLSDDELKIAFLIVSTFPPSEIEKSLQEEGIILDTGDFNWSQVAQLLRIEMYLRGIEDNIDFQEKYLSTKNPNEKKNKDEKFIYEQRAKLRYCKKPTIKYSWC